MMLSLMLPKSKVRTTARWCAALVAAAMPMLIPVGAAAGETPSRVVAAIDPAQRTTLTGNMHPLARAEFDRGAVAPATPIRRIQMVLQRSADQEAALVKLIDSQQDASNAKAFHQWLTPQSFAAEFGPSDRDLSTLTAWLVSQGFKNVSVNAGRTVVEFDGTAATVQSAFNTQMHTYTVKGEAHYANASDPQIPTALATLVGGFVSLNNFPRHPASHLVGNFSKDPATGKITPAAAAGNTPSPQFGYTSNNTSFYGITPYDFATIYNVLPLWNANTAVDGTGQTIAIVGQSDINPQDFVNFRKLFNLPIGSTNTPTGTQYLNIIYNGTNPGITGDEGEADLATQWSAAVAKGATIDYVASQTTEVSLGSDLSAAYIINNNLASVMSESFSSCELANGTGGNLFYKTLWQQAAAQGITVLVAAGDQGSAACEAPSNVNNIAAATTGLAVNGMASTPYNTAVGGTDFYLPNGGSGYFNSTNNATTQASAIGYIPETVWNNSCANPYFGTLAAYKGLTPEAVCNSAAAMVTPNPILTVSGAGGGPSSCITSNGTTPSSCAGGYPKPSWQVGAGVPADGVRDVPDVSLFAGSGLFNSFYIVCQQSQNADGLPCNLAAPTYDFQGYGGTSVAAPAFAGIMALVNQKTGMRQGVANYTLYTLAGIQTKAGTACGASGTPAAGCVFYDTTTGTNAQPCVSSTTANPSPNCTTTVASDAYGILSGYNAGTGYDLASGLGSVNVQNLVNSWLNVTYAATTSALTLTPATITHGSAVAAKVIVSAVSGTPTGNVAVIANANTGAQQNGTLTNGVYSANLSALPGGSYAVRAHYAGDGTYAASDSNAVGLTVNPEPSALKLQAILYQTYPTQLTTTVSTMPYGATFFIRADVAGASGQGSATGYVSINDGPNPLDAGVFLLNSSSYTEDQTSSLQPGLHTFTATYPGDNSFNSSTSSAVNLTITQGSTGGLLTTNTTNVSSAGTITLTAGITTTGFGLNVPTGTVTFMSGSTVIGTSILKRGNDPASPYDYSTAVLTIPASSLTVGSNSLTLVYSGDVNYFGVYSAPVTVTVTNSGLSTTTTTALATPANVLPNSAITFSAAVALTKSSIAPTGTVQFEIDGQNVGAPVAITGTTAGGSTSFATSVAGLTLGTHMLTATYSGDATYKSSISAPFPFTIAPPANPGVQNVVVAPTTVVQGTTILVTTTVGTVTTVPTGTAQLLVDGNFFGNVVTLANGSATLPLATLTLQTGLHVITVYYGGDTIYNSSYSNSTNVTVIAPGATASSVALTGVPATVVTGTSFTFTATVSPASPAPTGVLQLIIDNGIPQAPVTLATNGQVLAQSTSNLSLGQHTLSVFYSGDVTYRFSYSPTATFTVVVAPPPPPPPTPPTPPTPTPTATFTLTPSTASASTAGGSGSSAPVTFTVTPVNGFNSPITFVCQGLPVTAHCTFTPVTVTMNGTTAQTSNLVFTANVGQSEMKPLHLPGMLPIGGGVAFAGTLLVLLPKRRRRMRSLLIAAIAMVMIGGATGCGSGYYPGPYKVSVNAVGGGIVQTAVVTLTVQ